jgi:hypothetical protein
MSYIRDGVEYRQSNDSHQWWSQIKTDGGYIQRVEVTATNAIDALNIMKSLYGSQLIYENVNRC